MNPQPRPRKKADEPTWDDDEVLTPDEVIGDDETGGDEPPARPDRRPMWVLIAGITSIWFALTGAYFVFLPFVAIPLWAAVYGRITTRRLREVDAPQRTRRQATWGMGLGIVTTLYVIAQVVFIIMFFEWDKTDEDVDLTTEKPAVTTEAPPETTAPTATTGAPTATTLG